MLLRDKSEIILVFQASNEENGLSEDWTLKVNGDIGNEVEICVSKVQPVTNAIDFPLLGGFQWLQAEPELLSPVGLLALARNMTALHLQAFHTLVGLALSFGSKVRADLAVEDEETNPIIAWQSDPPNKEDKDLSPVYSHFDGSLLAA